MILWVICAAIALAVSGLLLLPLLRRSGDDLTAADYDIQVYRSQLAEVEKNATAGEISEAEAKAARTEISRRILAADRRRKTTSAGDGPAGRTPGQLALAGGVAVAVPLATFLL